MPVYYGTTSTTEMNETGNNDVKVHFWKPLLVLTFFYYVISCGIERIYQPMVIYLVFLTTIVHKPPTRRNLVKILTTKRSSISLVCPDLQILRNLA
jgi:hypothetical protein